MEKYVSFRIEKTTYQGAVNQASHDYRLHTPKYVDEERKNDNYTLYSSEEINSFNSWKQLHQDQQNRVKELTGRTARKDAQYFSKGIMTFSSTMREDYKNSPELFDECSKKYLERLNQELGLQCVYAQVHRDEFNEHIHLLFDNISKETGKAIQRSIKPKDLERAQDIMGECFEPMNYERGKSKSITNAKHLRVSELHQLQEIEQALKDDIRTSEDLISLYQQQNRGVMFLMRMLGNKGHIDVKSDKGRQAVAQVVEALEEQRGTVAPRPSLS